MMPYTSPDGRFSVRLDAPVIRQLLRYCRMATGDETGGVLVGRYGDGHRCAVVTRASGPGRGSEKGRASFYRAVGHLQNWLDRLWADRHTYYLGEWHFHPGSSPQPSGTDRSQMLRIARDRAYACPEPLLVIVGGDPVKTWSLSATIFTRSGDVLALREVEAE
jgi:integrative and conjugative element protein (TIGR02256 family)